MHLIKPFKIIISSLKTKANCSFLSFPFPMERNISRNKDQTLAATTYEEDDVEMLEALTLDDGGAVESPPRVSFSAPGAGSAGRTVDGGQGGKNKKKKKKNRRKNKAAVGSNIANINRFVLDTCKRLKERKSYLVWNAVACLGVSAVSDLVKEIVLLWWVISEQLDLGTRVQYALNIEQYDMAKMLRDKLIEVETDIMKQQQAKRGSSKICTLVLDLIYRKGFRI